MGKWGAKELKEGVGDGEGGGQVIRNVNDKTGPVLFLFFVSSPRQGVLGEYDTI